MTWAPDISVEANLASLERFIAWADRHDSNALWLQGFTTGYFDTLDSIRQMEWMLRLSPGFHGDFQKFVN